MILIRAISLLFVVLALPLFAYAEDLVLPDLETSSQEIQDKPILTPDPVFADSMPADQYERAVVLKVLDSGETDIGDNKTQPFQKIHGKVLSGVDKGKELDVDNGKLFSISRSQLLKKGDQFILVKSFKADGSSFYAVADRYRINQLALLGLCFLGLVAVVARLRGVMSFIGLVVSIGVLAFYEIPKLAAGAAPLPTTMIAATLIVLATIYLAHGFSRQTTIAVVSTVITLLVAAGMAMFFVAITHLAGNGSEEAFNLQFGQNSVIDLKGLYLSGILIGVLGVLDDVTTGQVAVVDQLHHANPNLGVVDLFRRASVVGREHIISLVNTLALAYAGVSIPLFLILAKNPQPLWISINGEFFAEEIVRTLVGSMSLVLAVPIATFLAARLLAHTKVTESHSHLHTHSH